MTQQTPEPPAAPATEEPFDDGLDELIARTTEERSKPPAETEGDDDDDSLLDDMIESIEEIPMLLFRPIRDLFRRDR